MATKNTARISRGANLAGFGTSLFPAAATAAKARVALACMILSATALPLAAQYRGELRAALPRHVPQSMRYASARPRDPMAANEQITFSVMLNLSDPAGFAALRQSLNDPNSPNYHHPISAQELTARFGPTQDAYNSVLAFLEQSGFTLVSGSSNRRTLTVRGTRAQAEAAFEISLDDYQLGSRTFRAMAKDPTVPGSLAPLIGGVSGLSNLAQLQSHAVPNPQTSPSTGTGYNGTITPAGSTNSGGLPPGLTGKGETIGLLEIDNYAYSDLSNTLAFEGLAGQIGQVSKFSVNGGTPVSGCAPTKPGCGTTEALLDIAAALGIAPGANVIAFIAPPTTDILTMVNSAIDQVNSVTGGFGGIISASLGICESEVSSSDATNLDGLLETASEYGLTFFAATGDNGSTCKDGSGNVFANTISYPADAPHAVAVGGTNLSVNADNSYNSESYWTGGGFGISTLFTEPSYQSALDPSLGGRSVPDVSAESQPGIIICQATTKIPAGCYAIGGTSLATPLWAGIWALMNEAYINETGGPGRSAGYNGTIYNYSKSFHSGASMGSDFEHVGLGSPNITSLVGHGLPYVELDSISPNHGSPDGGTKVTITGKGFVGVSKVTFGGADAKNITIHSDTKLTADSPAGTDDQVDVKITTPAGSFYKGGPNVFSYVPEVDKVKPDSGPFYGGTSVTVTGSALSDTYTFKFGGTAATKVSCSSSTQCTMVTPAHADGKVAVEVEAPVGNTSTPDLFTYQGLSISSFTPQVGPTTGGGVPVTINGVSLKSGMTVTFGTTSVTAGSCYDSTTCVVGSPNHAAGSVHLTVTVGGETSAASTDTFDFKVFPTITSISPSIVPVNTGTVTVNQTLVITGTGFSTTGTTFSLGAGSLTGVSCSGAKSCTAQIAVPPGVTSMTTDAVMVSVGGVTSLGYVNLTYPALPPPTPHCKGTTCS
jgi:hypothetical protein